MQKSLNAKSFAIPGSLLFVIALFFIACSKEGPAGPAGSQGPAGPQGPTGPQGPKGDTGTANVIYSGWLDVAYLPDKDTTRDQNGNIVRVDTIGYFANINAPRLTNTILSTGEMKVYVNFGTPTQPAVVPLPHLFNLTLSGLPFVFTITPTFLTQRIFLYSDAFDASTEIDPRQNNQKVWQYRYILIPCGTPSGRYAKINWDNYDEVKAYLDLKD